MKIVDVSEFYSPTGGGVRLDGEKLTDAAGSLKPGAVLQVGRRRFARQVGGSTDPGQRRSRKILLARAVGAHARRSIRSDAAPAWRRPNGQSPTATWSRKRRARLGMAAAQSGP